MYLFIKILVMLLCVLIITVVLVKPDPQSTGIASALGGGGSESAFGASGMDVITKALAVMGILFLAVTFGMGVFDKYQMLKPEKHLAHPFNWPIVKRTEKINEMKKKSSSFIQEKKQTSDHQKKEK